MFYFFHKKTGESFIANQEIDAEFFPEIVEYESVEFDAETIKNPYYENGEIKEKPQSETDEEKFARIFAKICSPEIILDANTPPEILEWVDFSDTAIGDVIANRVFRDEKTLTGNPHGQMAMMAKILANPEYFQSSEVQQKLKAINDIRVFFGLGKMVNVRKK